jgi:polysaccharide pyruvyl transferase WcaK-like protein
MDFFIGARTHATIAAYSTCVPTLVLGYSIKSQGIAKDIFGEIDKYVIKVNEIDNGEKLINAFNALYNDKDKIKRHLEKFMPEYIQRAYVGAKEVETLLQQK